MKPQHKCFPVKFAKFLRTPILKNICKWLLLSEPCQSSHMELLHWAFILTLSIISQRLKIEHAFGSCSLFWSLALREKCPNTEFFLVRIKSEYRKIRTRKNSVFGATSHSDVLNEPQFHGKIWKKAMNHFWKMTKVNSPRL